jgi:phospholipid/cholesterol/gamma-HCH transport system substrate-binding protein
VTVARGAALGALIAAIIAVGVLMFGSGGGQEYVFRFQNAGQLVNGNQVQIAGKSVGKISKIELTDDNEAEITATIDEDFAPLHEGTTASIRQPSLPSIANRFIVLAPGPNNAAELEEGSLIPADKTTAPVDLDQLFNTLDAKTRRSLQNVLVGFQNWYVGKGDELNRTFKYFGPSLSTTAAVMRELSADQKVFERFLIDVSRLVGALSERREDVAGFVSNTNTAFKAIADENISLAQALSFLPSTLRLANTTFVELRGALDELNELTNVTKPFASDLAPFFRRLDKLVVESTPTFKDFADLITKAGKNNDLTDTLRNLPRLDKVAQPSFSNSIKALRKSQPVIEFIRPYAADFTAWIEKFAHTTAYYDANGHYARVSPAFAAFRFEENGGDGILRKATDADRQNVLTDRGNDKRCPGGATQAAQDGSSPFTDDGRLAVPEDCDPSVVPPGP